MEIVISNSSIEDLDGVMSITEMSIKEMHSRNNHQWDTEYPVRKDFEEDNREGNLYIARASGKTAAGFASINEIQPEEYSTVDWDRSARALVIHRLATHPDFHKSGIASLLMDKAEDIAKKSGIRNLRTDTFSGNKAAQKLFERKGFKFKGQIKFRNLEKPFYCYEKIV